MDTNAIKTNFWIGIVSLILGFLICLILLLSTGALVPLYDTTTPDQMNNVTMIVLSYENMNETMMNDLIGNITLPTNTSVNHILVYTSEGKNHIIPLNEYVR